MGHIFSLNRFKHERNGKMNYFDKSKNNQFKYIEEIIEKKKSRSLFYNSKINFSKNINEFLIPKY